MHVTMASMYYIRNETACAREEEYETLYVKLASAKEGAEDGYVLKGRGGGKEEEF